MPLLLASITATLTSYLFFGQDVLCSFELNMNFKIEEIHYYILLGSIAGFVEISFHPGEYDLNRRDPAYWLL